MASGMKWAMRRCSVTTRGGTSATTCDVAKVIARDIVSLHRGSAAICVAMAL